MLACTRSSHQTEYVAGRRRTSGLTPGASGCRPVLTPFAAAHCSPVCTMFRHVGNAGWLAPSWRERMRSPDRKVGAFATSFDAQTAAYHSRVASDLRHTADAERVQIWVYKSYRATRPQQ